MRLNTQRLLIRYIEESDWSDIREIWKSVNQTEYAQYDKPHSTEAETVRPRIARWAQVNGGMEHMFFAVCLQEKVIGYVAFNLQEDGYEIGYCFHAVYHGKGFGKESLSALLGYLRKAGIVRVFARTAMNNYPSRGLLKSLGFEQIGKEKVSFYKDAHGNDIVFDGGIFEMKL